jgi:hypothetical protein
MEFDYTTVPTSVPTSTITHITNKAMPDNENIYHKLGGLLFDLTAANSNVIIKELDFFANKPVDNCIVSFVGVTHHQSCHSILCAVCT